jgi:prepilin-type N-terminal cleavage/methylation domain-containing protein
MNILINNPQSAIRNPQFARGFSLTEVLIAVGIIAVGMLFIAGSFPVSIHFTTVAAERTIAPIVADEAVAKIQTLWPLIGKNFPNSISINATEFAYPSTPTTDFVSKKYWWSPLYGYDPTDPNAIYMTVFVFRKANPSSLYWVRSSNTLSNLPADMQLQVSTYPTIIYVGVSASPSGRPDELAITDLDSTSTVDEASFINDGCTIVDVSSGQLRMYRVLERYPAYPNIIRLDKDWVGPLPPTAPAYIEVWVPSPAVDGSRYPCIGVYQKVMRF